MSDPREMSELFWTAPSKPWWAWVPFVGWFYERGFSQGYDWRTEQMRRGKIMGAGATADVDSLTDFARAVGVPQSAIDHAQGPDRT